MDEPLATVWDVSDDYDQMITELRGVVDRWRSGAITVTVNELNALTRNLPALDAIATLPEEPAQ